MSLNQNIFFTVCPSLQTGLGCTKCISGYNGDPYGIDDICGCNLNGSQTNGCDCFGQCSI